MAATASTVGRFVRGGGCTGATGRFTGATGFGIFAAWTFSILGASATLAAGRELSILGGSIFTGSAVAYDLGSDAELAGAAGVSVVNVALELYAEGAGGGGSTNSIG